MFIDWARIRVEAGTGGSGCSSFRREYRVPMGGPDGGDGGKGGDVILRGDRNLSTLLDYTYRDRWLGERGEHGMGSNKSGRAGKDVVLPVPPGTIVRNADTGEVVVEVLSHGDEHIIARGGRGGRGNSFFATSTHQSPREWQPGEEGQNFNLELELKLIADVGLVGEPNAGKSTLLSVISAARPKIGDYPFTTLAPNLGVVQLSNSRTFVTADIPGIIEGAHQGKGLGLQFLRHIERTRLLAFLIPIDSMDAQETFDKLRTEVEAYSSELARKPYCVVFTKTDLVDDDFLPPLEAPASLATFGISAVAHKGLEDFKEGVWQLLAGVKQLDIDLAAGGAGDSAAFWIDESSFDMGGSSDSADGGDGD